MVDLSNEERLVLLQHAILKYENENMLLEKLKTILSQKDIDRSIATLIATQRIKRIGSDMLQNNISHIGELPEIPSHIKQIVENL